jgi:FlaA1/EpsC-like NDP-sugar epimerase
MGRGDDIFVLDMGDPVKIDSLARQMIQLAGLTPEVDVAIEYTGLRPGEKLYEELWTEVESPGPTAHPGILRATSSEALPARLDREVARLLNAAADNDLPACWDSLLTLVPSFRGLRGDDAARAPVVERAQPA